MTGILLLAVATLIAGTLSAVTGFGGAAILLPLLVAASSKTSPNSDEE